MRTTTDLFTKRVRASRPAPRHAIALNVRAMDGARRTWIAVFNHIGGTISSGSLSSGYFDWGLPFHLGRNVYLGLEGTAANGSTITGPYAAY